MRSPFSTRPRAARACLLALFAGCVLFAARAAPGAAVTAHAPRLVHVPASPGAAAAALHAAAPGDTLRLEPGIHRGTLEVRVPVLLQGEPGAVLDGGGEGSVLRVGASGTVVEDLALRGSGRRVMTEDAAVQVLNVSGVTLRRLAVSDALYGVYAERAGDLRVEDCRLTGRVPPLKEDGEGNGIHLWYCENPNLTRNTVSRFADGVYLSFVKRADVRENHLETNGRYGLHTMYCQDNRLVANHFDRNAAGCAIMFSNHLEVRDNDFFHNRGPRTYGLLLRDCSDGLFAGNRMVDNTVAMFMDNSNRNRIRGNLLQDNGWGILMFSSCAGNEVAGNSFVNNDYPVSLDMRRSDNRFDDGRSGNYWSENAPYDLDGDGASDVPFSPVTAFAFISKRYPDLSILVHSPAVAALAVAERVIPALRPSEIVDHFPRVTPARVEGTGTALHSGRAPHAAWSAAVAFGLLAALGVAGLAWTRGRA